MACRPSAVRSMTTAISASLSEASPPVVSPSRVAVATTGTSSRSVHKVATALQVGGGRAAADRPGQCVPGVGGRRPVVAREGRRGQGALVVHGPT